MNITDIEDKIIKKANESGKSFEEVSRFFEKDYFEDMKNLNIELPDVVTRVSEFVPEIIQFIKKLEENGYAYRANGSVYFNVKKYNDGVKHTYPKLKPDESEEKSAKDLAREAEGVLTSED